MKRTTGMEFWRLGVLLVLFTFTAWGCSNGSNVIKISSWGDVKENAILQGLIDDFQKSHPDIKVDLERVPWGE